MGAWGHRNFENDDAMDGVGDLESRGLAWIEAAFASVEKGAGNYVEAPECTSALAAAEVVASLLGHPSDDLPERVAKWAKGKPKPNPALVKRAVATIDLIAEASELKDLWADTEDFEPWMAVVANLRARLTEK